jgi:hypothetical protein
MEKLALVYGFLPVLRYTSFQYHFTQFRPCTLSRLYNGNYEVLILAIEGVVK